MKTTYLIIILTAFLGFNVQAQTQWKQVKPGTKVNFKIKNTGLTVNGHFTGVAATIKFNPKSLGTSSITASLKTETIKTGISARDKHLRNEDYFYAEKYPKIIMKSKSFSKSSNGKYIGKFSLTMRGITKEVTVPFTFTKKGSNAVFKGSFKINRLNYKVGGKSWVLSNTAVIDLNIEVTP